MTVFPIILSTFTAADTDNILDTSRAGWSDLSTLTGTLPPDFGTSTSGVMAQKSASGPGQRPLQEI